MELPLILLCSLITTCLSQTFVEEFPDILDMFQPIPGHRTLAESTLDYEHILTNNVTFDVEKLDMEQFQKKYEAIIKKFPNETNPDVGLNNNTRRNIARHYELLRKLEKGTKEFNFNETRKQIPYLGVWWVGEWRQASRNYYKRVMMDNMLQVIYMARHKIRDLESQKYFNTKDTSYRMAFLFRRLRRMWKKMMDILYIMIGYRHATTGNWYRPRVYLQLHHRAAKIHVDFLYLWWVTVRIHEAFLKRSHIIMTKPPSTAETTLVSPTKE